MALPGVDNLLTERQAFLATIESLTDEEFEHGTTLCEEWSPRDVLAHLLGVDEGLPEYAKAYGNIRKANAVLVARYASMSRQELTERAQHWASIPPMPIKLSALFLLGDVAVHHQDVLRGLGRNRDIPKASRDAILREGMVLGGPKLLTHRVVPSDGGRALGRGTVVRGTTEALGLWLAGRTVVENELTFTT